MAISALGSPIRRRRLTGSTLLSDTLSPMGSYWVRRSMVSGVNDFPLVKILMGRVLVRRISVMVSSRSSMARSTRLRTMSGTGAARRALFRDMPVAKTRCTTRSCMSRAIRSRSRKTSSCSYSVRASASINVTAAWAAKASATSMDGPVSRGTSWSQSSPSTPRLRSAVRMGIATAVANASAPGAPVGAPCTPGASMD